GNPLLEPPEAITQALVELTASPRPGQHRYMPNAGFPETRAAVARTIAAQEKAAVSADDIIMTVGAAGGLNVALRSILDPGDEVIILAPYFVEYLFYVRFQGGSPRVVDTTERFNLDIGAIEAAITPKTKAIIINTPNNPTGVIYTPEEMRDLGACLAAAEDRLGHPIYIIADTPYAKLTFGDAKNPPLFANHPHTILAHSHSKDLGLAGERIGYLVVNPDAPARHDLRAALTFCNRALGFVNAPALIQLALARAPDAIVDIDVYRGLKERLCDGLRDAGYDFVEPQGAFYVFAKTPIADDVAFTEALQRHNVLVVPGRGFGRAGHVRIAFCVTPATLEGGLPAFAKVSEELTHG
ncbi:MAG: pyridoxal phosphate-dependent aminotransferase, partial [Deltaproteobacteria bacterium]|nr:pyridoxal phosphate-dependent aminotransferase [Deltaproteobacteria bacterium]